MHFNIGENENELRGRIRDFVKTELPSDWFVYIWDEEAFTDEDFEFSVSISKKLSKKGWLTMSWPVEYGGKGASLWESAIFKEEAGYWSIPGTTMGVGGVDWIGPSLLKFGTEEQKKTYLPLISSGDVDGIWCAGYSEPDAGSDLANIRTQAVRENDYYVINGQKVWTSAAHRARWMWLAAVTDPNAPSKHRGISIFIVDMQSEGVTVNPIINYVGFHGFNEVFLDDVRVPVKNLVGEEGKGWNIMMFALTYERQGIGPLGCGFNKRLLDELVQYAKKTGCIRNPVIRHKLADCAIDVEMGRMLVNRTIWKISKGESVVHEPAIDKVIYDEGTKRLSITGMEILGEYSQVDPVHRNSRWTKLQGVIETAYWQHIGIAISAGSDDIERNIIGQYGLGLPKSY